MVCGCVSGHVYVYVSGVLYKENKQTYNAIDKLHISRTLAVAIPRSILCTRLISLILGQPTILIHRNKVQRAIQPAANLGNVYIKRKLIPQQRKHLIICLILHQVQPTPYVLTIRAVGDKLDAELVTRRGYAIGTRVVCAVKTAVLGTGCPRGADGGVPFVTGVAVGRAVGEMGPAPVGVDDYRALSAGAAGGGAFGPGEWWVGFGGEGAGLLGFGCCDEGEGGDEEGHFDGVSGSCCGM